MAAVPEAIQCRKEVAEKIGASGTTSQPAKANPKRKQGHRPEIRCPFGDSRKHSANLHPNCRDEIFHSERDAR